MLQLLTMQEVLERLKGCATSFNGIIRRQAVKTREDPVAQLLQVSSLHKLIACLQPEHLNYLHCQCTNTEPFKISQVYHNSCNLNYFLAVAVSFESCGHAKQPSETSVCHSA